MKNLKTFEQFINEDNSKESVITEKVKEIEIGKTYKVSKKFRSGSNSIDKGTEIEILDIGNNFAEVEVFDGPFGMGTKMELEISDLEKYLVESVNEGKNKVDVASLSIGNTYKDNKGYPVKVIDIEGTGNRWKVTYQYEDGKKKTVSTSLDKGINLYESINERRKPITKKHWDKADDDQKEEWLLQAFEDPDDAMEYVEMDWNDLPPQATSNMYESL